MKILVKLLATFLVFPIVTIIMAGVGQFFFWNGDRMTPSIELAGLWAAAVSLGWWISGMFKAYLLDDNA
jgi:hypothetical protein